ncbi:MAG: bacillithiol biosynthesis deacetylase BshB1 [Tunicatimonas sp.]
MKLDILALAAHPDDTELGCAGTLAAHVAAGQRVGIVDFTQGELGTRGTPELRAQEAEASRQVLGVAVRHNLGFADGFFINDKMHQLEVAKMIRQYRPDVVLANAIYDRHPDHGRGAELARDACFIAGLRQVETRWKGETQEAWRPARVYHYIQAYAIKPDFVVDVSEHWETKMRAIRSFSSQFGQSPSDEPETYLTSPIFLQFIEARAKELGHSVGVAYGEGFTAAQPLGIKQLTDVF